MCNNKNKDERIQTHTMWSFEMKINNHKTVVAASTICVAVSREIGEESEERGGEEGQHGLLGVTDVMCGGEREHRGRE